MLGWLRAHPWRLVTAVGLVAVAVAVVVLRIQLQHLSSEQRTAEKAAAVRTGQVSTLAATVEELAASVTDLRRQVQVCADAKPGAPGCAQPVAPPADETRAQVASSRPAPVVTTTSPSPEQVNAAVARFCLRHGCAPTPTAQQVLAAVEAVYAAHPPPAGRTPTTAELRALADSAVRAWCAPRSGCAGPAGAPGPPGAAATGAPGPAGPAGPAGAGVASMACVDDDTGSHWTITLSDERTLTADGPCRVR